MMRIKFDVPLVYGPDRSSYWWCGAGGEGAVVID